MEHKLYPLKFHPIYKEKIWGGRRFEHLLGRNLPPGPIGESWDVAAHANGTSVVAEGPLAGWDLAQLAQAYGSDLVGEEKFPLLLKLIDANQDLSVQVHPDDAYVRAHTSEVFGKTEMWYIIHSEPGAWIIWGLRPGVTKQQFAAAIQAGGGEILACLNKVHVTPGELYPISAGLVHALGAGVVVAEIQQNSDTTYRVYDWDRIDDQGQPRDLHVEQALDVIDFQPEALGLAYHLARCERYFRMEILAQPQGVVLDLMNGFQILTALGGRAEILWEGGISLLRSGESCLLPACLGRCYLRSNGIVLQSTQGQLD
ncbi:MAG TPA: mannose-6-phosphate isomerase [Firmicutes bacterium]|nr:mannose-6-phosphate isomerase [Bacillota bacterium]